MKANKEMMHRPWSVLGSHKEFDDRKVPVIYGQGWMGMRFKRTDKVGKVQETRPQRPRGSSVLANVEGSP